MVYAYWRAGRHNLRATFDLFFRTPPFNSSFAIFAGLDQCLHFLSSFIFTPAHLDYLAASLPHLPPDFFDYLATLTPASLTLHAQREGAVVFAPVPLLRATGPLALIQLLQSPLLNLINYPTLVATNAMRFRLAASPSATLLEFGLCMAQGPDGAVTASRAAYIGGFDCTSNLAAGHLFDLPICGSQTHAFVLSFSALTDLPDHLQIRTRTDTTIPAQKLALRALHIRDAIMRPGDRARDGELMAFMAAACVAPDAFVAVVDTFDTLQCGVPNFMAVALSLFEVGVVSIGVRLDSGEFGELSVKIRRAFCALAKEYVTRFADEDDVVMEMAKGFKILVSNDLSVERIMRIREGEHDIDGWGVTANLVTCSGQGALGGVFEVVNVDGMACMKLWEESGKLSLPGEKVAYRLYGRDGLGVCDVIGLESEGMPVVGQEVEVWHMDGGRRGERMTVRPSWVEEVLHLVWSKGGSKEELEAKGERVQRARDLARRQCAELPRRCFEVDGSGEGLPVVVMTGLVKMVEEMMASGRSGSFINSVR